MAASDQTPNYDLPIYATGDKLSFTGDWNNAMSTLDTEIREVSLTASSVNEAATSALTVANAAQTTANTANTKVDSALTAANSANTKADTALAEASNAASTANTAHSTAIAAQTAANTASNTVQAQIPIINQAVDDANEASSTAAALGGRVTAAEANITGVQNGLTDINTRFDRAEKLYYYRDGQARASSGPATPYITNVFKTISVPANRGVWVDVTSRVRQNAASGNGRPRITIRWRESGTTEWNLQAAVAATGGQNSGEVIAFNFLIEELSVGRSIEFSYEFVASTDVALQQDEFVFGAQIVDVA